MTEFGWDGGERETAGSSPFDKLRVGMTTRKAKAKAKAKARARAKARAKQGQER
jgi:hypothetical protein